MTFQQSLFSLVIWQNSSGELLVKNVVTHYVLQSYCSPRGELESKSKALERFNFTLVTFQTALN